MSAQSNNTPIVQNQTNQPTKKTGCTFCGARGNGIRYCECGAHCCDHIGFLCPQERNENEWTRFWKMMQSDLVLRPETCPTKPPTASQGGDLFNPCNRGQYHGMTRDCWK